MIHINRNKFPSPLNPELVTKIKARFHDFYSQPPEVRRKQQLCSSERNIIGRQAHATLIKLFRNKCAYCESELGVSSRGEIDLFRPYTDASDLTGEGSPDHYGWLSADWGNLYVACPTCSRSKRSFFPIEGKRAEVLMPLKTARKVERPLLIDPCNDNPAKHIKFTEFGTAEALSIKGEVTIQVLNLNRTPLVKARHRVWRDVHKLSDNIERLVNLDSDLAAMHQLQLESLGADTSPYCATAREAIRTLRAVGPRLVSDSYSRPVRRETRSADQILADDGEAFRLSARPLKQVEIINFRALRNVSLKFGEPGSERAPWLMLLGENGTGKSTVLQAIALALAGADEAQRLTRPSRLLSVGAFEGSIVIWFWDQDTPVELHFRRSHKVFKGTRGPSAIVLAYGALRYAERRARTINPGPRFSRIEPIFQPIARVPYAIDWLLRLDEKRFATAARALQAILPIDSESIMLRSNDTIFFDIGGHRATLGELSAGYQTVVGMCADIMRHLFERWDTLTSATGIVLIDEIDAHLHPRWTMRIVGALRSAFPQVQFVASTHAPLALRGLRNGEVTLLRRDDDGAVVVDQNLPPLEGMQVDQLLTSRVFGLESTVDPETEALLNEFYHLKSLPPEPARLIRIEQIRERVADREDLGRSESERLMLQATSEFVRDSTKDSVDAPPLRNDTLRALREIAERGLSRRRRRQ